MPSRKPLGTYVRDTADQFQHARGRAHQVISQGAASGSSIGLFNNQQQGKVCHILGVTIYLPDLKDQPDAIPIGGAYYSSLPSAGGGVITGYGSAIESFFDLDPVPAVSLQYGGPFGDAVTEVTGTMIPPFPFFFVPSGIADNENYQSIVYYPPGGVAAFKPMRGFALWVASTDNFFWEAMFDFVMLSD